jgi:hypothetical protein
MHIVNEAVHIPPLLFECSRELMDQSLIVSVLVCATTTGLPYVIGVFYKEKNEIKYKYEIRSLYISQKSVKN